MRAHEGRAPGNGIRVAVALYGDITFDSRVQRESAALGRDGYAVTIYCLGGTLPRATADSGEPVVSLRTHLPTASSITPGQVSPYTTATSSSIVSRLLERVRWMLGYIRNVREWGRWAIAEAGDVDIWHLHDMTALMAVAPHVSGPTKFVYDSHEIFLEMGSALRLPRLVRRMLGMYERRLAGRAEALITVNRGLADYLTRRLRPKSTLIVRNCAPRWRPEQASPNHLRRAIGAGQEVSVILYHGKFSRSRGIEQVIEAIAEPELAAAHLALLGYGEAEHELERVAAASGVSGRVHFLPAVPPGDLQAWISGADVGVATYIGSSLNQRLATPNKIWECISAGVPVVASDFPMMREVIVHDPLGPLGAVCDPEDVRSVALAIASTLGKSPDDRSAMRDRCLAAAHDRLNWESEAMGLADLYERVSRT